MKPVFQGIALLIFGLTSSTLTSAFMLKNEIERVVNDIERGIEIYDNKEKLCELHSEFQVQSLYVLSNPFRDFDRFHKTNEYCDKKEYL